MKNRQMLSDGSSQNLDWNDLAVGADRIFVTWEDERDLLILYVDVFQYVWRSAQTIGSSNVTIGFGSEKELVTQAQLMSIPIQPEMFQEWRQLFSIGIIPSSCTSSTISWMRMEQLCYKQMFRTGRTSLISLPPLSGYGEHFPAPQLITSPFSINGISQLSSEKTSIPPITSILLDPTAPNGNNNWYITPIMVTFTVVDVDSDPENITTYYNTNGFGANIYIEYWSNDSINEELPHHRVEGLKIDTTTPMITLYKPPYIVSPGSITINGSVTEYTNGSGIERVQINVADETVYDTQWNGASQVWFEWHFTADLGESYDIDVNIWDKAGNKMQERRTVQCPEHGIYESRCIYLFNNPKIGPVRFLVTLGLSIAVNNDALYIILPDVASDASSVRFVATRSWLKQQFNLPIPIFPMDALLICWYRLASML